MREFLPREYQQLLKSLMNNENLRIVREIEDNAIEYLIFNEYVEVVEITNWEDLKPSYLITLTAKAKDYFS